MVEENPLTWESEPFTDYLDQHSLYRGIHQCLWIKWSTLDRIQPHFFYSFNAIKGLSLDWSKYSTPEETLRRLREPHLTKNGIIDLNVGKLRNCIEENNFPLSIAHDPQPINRAHTLIHGIPKCNKTKVRRKISKIAEWALDMRPIIEE